MAAKFDSGVVIRESWELTKKNVPFLIKLVVFGIGVGIVTRLLTKLANFSEESILPISLINMVINAGFSLGVIKAFLKIVDGKEVKMKEFYWFGARTMVIVWVASLLYGLLVTLGLVLLLVPGIIWSLEYGQFTTIIVDKKMGPMAALKYSKKITKGSLIEIGILGLKLLGLNILGALILGVGLLATIPVSMFAGYVVYRKLSNELETPAVVSPVQ